MNLDSLQWVNHLPITNLDQMNAVAARQTRIDRKYLVPVDALASLIEQLEDVKVLDIAGQRLFDYTSIYLDDRNYRTYHQAGRKRRRRYKLRVRRYEVTGDEFLEVKWKDGRKQTHKARRVHNGQLPLSEDAIDFVDQTLSVAGIEEQPISQFTPSLVTKYRRITLFFPESKARATIDFELSCESNCGTMSLSDTAIIETKAGTQFTELDRILHRNGYREGRISKYALGLAATVPELPAQKWNRTLKGMKFRLNQYQLAAS